MEEFGEFIPLLKYNLKQTQRVYASSILQVTEKLWAFCSFKSFFGEH
jgi:hypothetical protein